MGWQELIEKITGELDAEVDKIRAEALEKKKTIIDGAKKSAEDSLEAHRNALKKEAGLIYDEIISAGRIEAGSVIRKTHSAAVERLYGRFREKLMKDGSLKKNILNRFLEENYASGRDVTVSQDAASVLGKSVLSKFGASVSKNTLKPVTIKWGKITATFDWDEFIGRFREKTRSEVYRILGL